MRMIFPRRSLVLLDDRAASYCSCPGISFIGPKPLFTYFTFGSSNGFALSPVETYNNPSGPKATEPPVWQQIFRCDFTSRIVFSVAPSIVSFLNVNLDKRFTALSKGL